MAESIIQQKSFQFALEIIHLYIKLQEQREYVLSKQLLRIGRMLKRLAVVRVERISWQKCILHTKKLGKPNTGYVYYNSPN
ncbi:MAG: four helix bundle protein [Nostoc sp. ChiQUE02]|uniref:four helix bundle protein n=1 Tax=Nostoc sp. ChiQUE02 TaxID=3075377 RepID=UPI002AD2BE0A|nr:four helix bundle protein [Nostoc sp. ChiQUE02]MDZ8229488.1 four helix bundle protein [Nostoc sp. ChiQUE02]